MTIRRCLLLVLACCLAGLCVPLGLGLSYSERVSSPQGFYQVRVEDHLAPVAGLRRPRRAVLVVLDGLGYMEAQTMPSLALLRGRGQCRKTSVGPLSLSRPVYAVLSTGLEQDRTGARSNNDDGPLGAESLWDVARQAGLSVAAVSELPWWRELFPRGFSSYVTPPRQADYFRLLPAADLTLIHPIYIDETGHEWGAGSGRYRAAVTRADRELSGLLDTLDLSQDLLVVTADHGHSLRGGHGGQQDRVAHVLTCYAGAGVRHLDGTGALRATTVAPSLALLLGLRFPASMRAGDDDLDTLWDIVDPSAFPADYLAGRRQAIARFRARNHDQLLRWLPRSAGSWTAFSAWHRCRQLLAALPFGGLVLLLLALHQGAHRLVMQPGPGEGRAGAWFGRAWMALVFVGTYALHVALRGSFDLTSVEHRAGFIRFTLALGALVGAGAAVLHVRLGRRLPALLLDQGGLLLLGTVLSLAHPAALGWHVGFPLPPPELFFFPYFAALFIPALSGVALAVCLFCWIRQRRRGVGPASEFVRHR